MVKSAILKAGLSLFAVSNGRYSINPTSAFVISGFNSKRLDPVSNIHKQASGLKSNGYLKMKSKDNNEEDNFNYGEMFGKDFSLIGDILDNNFDSIVLKLKGGLNPDTILLHNSSIAHVAIAKCADDKDCDKNGLKRLLTQLGKSGANLNMKNDGDFTPETIAKELGQYEIAEHVRRTRKYQLKVPTNINDLNEELTTFVNQSQLTKIGRARIVALIMGGANIEAKVPNKNKDISDLAIHNWPVADSESLFDLKYIAESKAYAASYKKVLPESSKYSKEQVDSINESWREVVREFCKGNEIQR